MDGLKFDLKKMSAREMQTFLKAIKDNDFEAEATIFAKTATSVPKEWGNFDMHNPEAWLDLPHFDAFRPAVLAFVEAGTEISKK